MRRLGIGLVVAWVALVGCSSRSSNDAAGGASGGTAGVDGGGSCQPTTHSCQPTPPSGWTPILVIEGLDQDTCVDPIVAGSSVTGAPAACAACSCGAIAGGTCESSITVKYGRGASTCDGTGCMKEVQFATDGTCYPVPVVCSGPLYEPYDNTFPEVQLTGGTCTPNPVAEPTLAPAQFVDPHTLCSVQPFAGDCGPGRMCFLKPPSNAVPRYCVQSETSDPCPIDYPHERAVLYSGFDDSRSCSSCGCGIEGLFCDLKVETFTASGCPGTGSILSFTPGQCTVKLGSHVELTATPEPGATCAPNGGEPTGEVSPSKATKICCTEA